MRVIDDTGAIGVVGTFGVDVSEAALTARLEAAKADPVLGDRVARLPELHEAVAEVFRWMGFSAHVASGTTDGTRWSNRHWVTAVVLDSTTILLYMPGVGEGADWRRTLPDEATRQAKIRTRARIVWKHAQVLLAERKDLHRLVTLADHDAPEPLDPPAGSATRAWWGLVLTCWWQARISEGHSPESARMLLALTAHPYLLHAFPHTPVRVSAAF